MLIPAKTQARNIANAWRDVEVDDEAEHERRFRVAENLSLAFTQWLSEEESTLLLEEVGEFGTAAAYDRLAERLEAEEADA